MCALTSILRLFPGNQGNCRNFSDGVKPNYMPKTERRKFGDYGEKVAEHYLTSKGYEIIDRNYCKPWGEIDLVAKHDEYIVFCEVKTRDSKNSTEFLPEYSINYKKIKNLNKICETYLQEKGLQNSDQQWRIDVISISIDQLDKKAKINHIENAIWGKKY